MCASKKPQMGFQRGVGGFYFLKPGSPGFKSKFHVQISTEEGKGMQN